MMKTPDQMELGLTAAECTNPSIRRRRRKMQRAKWWFHRMRTEVQNAHERASSIPAPQST
jgi:hypothetical protein